MPANLQQIAAAANRNASSMCQQIKKLKKQKKFKKRTPGKIYSDNEVAELEKIFDFKFIKQ